MKKNAKLIITLIIIVIVGGAIVSWKYMGAKSTSTKSTPTITQGIYGTVQAVTNCTSLNENCKKTPLQTTVYIYEATSDITTGKIVAKGTSDKNGFYQIEVVPGMYSVITEYNEKKDCNVIFGSGELCVTQVETGLRNYPVLVGGETLED